MLCFCLLGCFTERTVLPCPPIISVFGLLVWVWFISEVYGDINWAQYFGLVYNKAFGFILVLVRPCSCSQFFQQGLATRMSQSSYHFPCGFLEPHTYRRETMSLTTSSSVRTHCVELFLNIFKRDCHYLYCLGVNLVVYCGCHSRKSLSCVCTEQD